MDIDGQMCPWPVVFSPLAVRGEEGLLDDSSYMLRLFMKSPQLSIGFCFVFFPPSKFEVPALAYAHGL